MKENNPCGKCMYNVDGMFCAVCGLSLAVVRSNLGGRECASYNTRPELPKLIGLCGFARAGKDTVADFICENNSDYQKMSFAKILKEECNRMMEAVGEDICFYREDDKVLYRDILVFWGKFRRERFDSYYWIKKLEKSIPQDSHVIITDVRYPNEAEWIKGRGGIVIYIERPGTEAANHEELRTVNQILDSGLIDFTIENDSDLESLRKKILVMFG